MTSTCHHRGLKRRPHRWQPRSSSSGRQGNSRRDTRNAKPTWRGFLKLLATVAGPEPRALDALAALLMDTALSNPTDVPDVHRGQGDRSTTGRHPIPSVTLNRDAHPRGEPVPDYDQGRTQLSSSSRSTQATSRGRSSTAASTCCIRHSPSATKPTSRSLIGAGPMARSRVTRSFDLVGARSILSADVTDNGLVDWSRAIPYVEMQPPIGMSSVPSTTAPQNLPQRLWKQPQSPHGTHVAGILGADWPENGLRGICPRIRLFDVRVLGDKGRGDEFSIMAALSADPPHQRASGLVSWWRV